MSVMGELLEAFQKGVSAHDTANPDHSAYGIGMAQFDMERLGLDEGETILPGITMHADGKCTGNFRILCDGQHQEREQETVKAVYSDPNPARMDPVYA